MNITLRRVAVGASAALTAVGLAIPVSAEPVPWTYTYEGSEAVCSFPLVVSGMGEGTRVYKEFEGKDDTLRTRSAGTGDALTFKNGDTGASFSTKSNGSVARSWIDGDFTTTVMTGHNVILLFPSDTGGPSATLYGGRVIFTVDGNGTWEVVQASGPALDICARLTAS